MRKKCCSEREEVNVVKISTLLMAREVVQQVGPVYRESEGISSHSLSKPFEGSLKPQFQRTVSA